MLSLQYKKQDVHSAHPAMAPQVGLEPTTTRLTAECSAIELLRNIESENLYDSPLLIGIRRRPTLPGRCQPSTISAKRLNFCVRYGNRWVPLAIITGNCFSVFSHRASASRFRSFAYRFPPLTCFSRSALRALPRTFTTAQTKLTLETRLSFPLLLSYQIKPSTY